MVKHYQRNMRFFVKVCTKLIEKYIPKIRIKVGEGKPKWMTREVANQIEKKEKAWKRLKARRTPLRGEKYRQERNKTTVMVKLAKLIFERKLAKDIKLNPKQFWNFVRSRTRVKEYVLRMKKQNGMMTEDDVDTANVLNRAFCKCLCERKCNGACAFPELGL